jgi:hypothetical protein
MIVRSKILVLMLASKRSFAKLLPPGCEQACSACKALFNYDAIDGIYQRFYHVVQIDFI